MRINKLTITYGGFFSTHYDLSKKGNMLCYEQWDCAPQGNIKMTLRTHAEWTRFVNAIIDIIKNWKDDYFTEILDGTQWEIRLKADGKSFHISGSNDAPDNFMEFVKLVRTFTGEDFAEGYEDEECDEGNRIITNKL